MEEPDDFQPTIERLEALHKFKELYKGDHLPDVNPWRPAATPTAGASLSGAGIRPGCVGVQIFVATVCK